MSDSITKQLSRTDLHPTLICDRHFTYITRPIPDAKPAVGGGGDVSILQVGKLRLTEVGQLERDEDGIPVQDRVADRDL